MKDNIMVLILKKRRREHPAKFLELNFSRVMKPKELDDSSMLWTMVDQKKYSLFPHSSVIN